MGVVVGVTILENEDQWRCKSYQAFLRVPCPFTALFSARYEADDKRGGYVIRCLGGDSQERRHLCVIRSGVRVCFVSVSLDLFGSK